MKPRIEVSLGDRLITYALLLKQLDVVTQELETVGFVTLADRDRWEKLICPERLRVGVAMKALGVSPLSRLPSLEAAKAAGNGSLTKVKENLTTGIPALDAAQRISAVEATAEYRGLPVPAAVKRAEALGRRKA